MKYFCSLLGGMVMAVFVYSLCKSCSLELGFSFGIGIIIYTILYFEWEGL